MHACMYKKSVLYFRLGIICYFIIIIIFTHKKLKLYLELKQNKKAIACNVVFVLSFLKGVDILSWKEINAMRR